MARSLADKAYVLIRADLVACVFAPGQQVVQAALAARYHLGTTPVRDALQRLVQEGLVQSLPRFGHVIRPITVMYLQEMYEMRSILEPVAARAATMCASDEKLQEIAREAVDAYVYDRSFFDVAKLKVQNFRPSPGGVATWNAYEWWIKP